jgi:hypothetical protein
MVANALLATVVVVVALGFALLDACQSLIPFRDGLLRQHGPVLALVTAVLALNVFAAAYWLGRALFLKDTGRKLAHVEKQIREGRSLVADLADRLED